MNNIYDKFIEQRIKLIESGMTPARIYMSTDVIESALKELTDVKVEISGIEYKVTSGNSFGNLPLYEVKNVTDYLKVEGDSCE